MLAETAAGNACRNKLVGLKFLVSLDTTVMPLKPNSQSNLVVYELNEVPPRVIKDYCHYRPNSFISQLASHNGILETICSDEGELHPWSTWPTLHRGVPRSKHRIHSLNQDLLPSANYPPIWETLLEHNISIGVFGSLHTYPCPSPSSLVKFYVPDTFSPSSESSSLRLSKLQAFNLLMSSYSKVSPKPLDIYQYSQFLRLLIRGDASTSFLFSCFRQFCLEIFNKHYAERRPYLQAELMFPAFLRHLKISRPRYCSFFTNHVASVMHRFWCYSYPKDYASRLGGSSSIRANHIFAALDIVDRQLSLLGRFCYSNNYDLWILSSMGQKAVSHYDSSPELILNKPKHLLNALGLSCSDVTHLPSMHPDVVFRCSTLKSKETLAKTVSEITDSSGCEIMPLLYSSEGSTLNFTLRPTAQLFMDECINIKGKSHRFSDVGFGSVSRRRATAYHDPIGSFLYTGSTSVGLFASLERDTPLDTTLIIDYIKSLFCIS